MKKGERIVPEDHPIVQKKIKKSLDLSIKEGGVASASNGFGLSYFSPFALAMKATAVQIGILNAIINLLPSIIQVQSAKLVEKYSRKKIVITAVVARLFLWIPIILTGVLFYLGVPHMVWAFIFLISLYYSFMALGQPAWYSWMGSLVPKEGRGRYFSKRNRTVGFFGIVTMIIGALILDFTKSFGTEKGNIIGFTLIGFGILFTLSFLAKLWSLNLLRKQYEPKIKVKKKDYFTFRQFLKKIKSTPFGKFCLCRGINSFAVGIATPFWVVYMIRHLEFSYIWYITITVSALFFQLIFLPVLGKVSDRFGNIRLMKISSIAIFLVPIFWALSILINSSLTLKLYLIFVPSLIAGFAWAGYNLAINNYVYDAVKTEKRTFAISYMNLIVGLSIFAGASVGSFLAWLNVSFMNPLIFIFLVSAAARLISLIVEYKILEEVRPVKKFSPNYLMKEFQPIQGTMKDMQHFGHIIKRKVEHFI